MHLYKKSLLLKFSDFLNIQQQLASLPKHPTAHYLAMPPQREAWVKLALQRPDPPKKAAVLCCFFPDQEGITHFALIKRQASKHAHGGQYALPGGRREESDSSNWETALREAEEEVQIIQDRVHYVRDLQSLYIPPSHFEVFPFVGYLDQPPALKPQLSEVAAVYPIPLARLLNPENLGEIPITTSYMKQQPVPAFNLDGHMVWGATAMMLAELRELIASVDQ